MSLSSYEFQAINEVVALLKERLQSEYTHAGDGTGLSLEDAAVAGMVWAKRVGSVSAYKEALAICERVSRELMGGPKKAKGD